MSASATSYRPTSWPMFLRTMARIQSSSGGSSLALSLLATPPVGLTGIRKATRRPAVSGSWAASSALRSFGSRFAKGTMWTLGIGG